MANKVGARGQVTIKKSIRDSLGVEKGWTVLQRLVNGHVELHFVPPRARQVAKRCAGQNIPMFPFL